MMGLENQKVSKAEFDKFLIDLTVLFEFDYVELFTPLEVI